MINVDAELNRLRHRLTNQQWSPSEIDEIIDLASNDINEVILDIVSNAVAEATDHATKIGADEFVDDLDVVEVGGGFILSTRSGKTDYSVPEKQMLPDLLKNAKTAEDGSRYKVIPVGASENKTIQKDVFSVLQDKQRNIQQVREQMRQYNQDLRSARANQVASTLRQQMREKMQASRAPQKVRHNTGQQPNFRTASSKQDPSEKWVLPAKELDMTGYLMDTNKRIEESIQDSVSFIIGSYEKEFA